MAKPIDVAQKPPAPLLIGRLEVAMRKGRRIVGRLGQLRRLGVRQEASPDEYLAEPPGQGSNQAAVLQAPGKGQGLIEYEPAWTLGELDIDRQLSTGIASPGLDLEPRHEDRAGAR